MEGHTVLVVDDEPASLRALQRTLSPHHRVLAATSGDAGLELLGRHPISLIITDHRMPGLSGVEVLARCRVTHPDVVRIVLTGYADVDALIDAINDGAVFYYLTKPWEPRELMLAVRRGLDHLEAELERRALLRDLEHACARARRESEHNTRLLATAAHELGTPVHLLGNALQLLSGIGGVSESEWFALADRNLMWLKRSLAQIRTAFRLRVGEVRLRRACFDLGLRLRQLTHAIQRASHDRRLDFETEINADLRLEADETWLDQVWISLLSNAVRFTPDGGRVTVTAAIEGQTARVRVDDSGIGMTAAQLACAFEPFSSAAGDLLLHSSGRFEFLSRGMGLGLSIARAIVALHGGSIGIASEPRRGTAVDVLLPRGN